ncbi:MAG TPA: hypothetical protein VJL88_13800 [Nitrospira sp.]|nr:hypothetical protein [Nitrospira sp.]
MLRLGNIGLLTTALLLALTALGSSPPPSTEPPQEDAERESLRGLNGVEVRVEPLDSDIEQRGLSEGKLEQDIRQRLQKAGLKVLTERERLATPTAAILIVRLDTTHDRIGRFFYSTDLLLTQRVKLETPGAPEVSAVTWKKLGVVSTVADDNVKHLEDQVLRKVDQFIKDYLAANADKRKP